MPDDSFAADLSSAMSDTSTQDAGGGAAAPAETTAQPGAATTQPADATAATSTETVPKTGPIPFDVHKTALDNARAKTREEVEAEWQAYAWAKQIPQDTLQRALQFYSDFSTGDPVEILQKLAAQVQAHPEHGARLKSLAARTLAARTQQADPEPQPDLPLQLEDGRVVHLYSAEQQAKREAWLRNQWLAQVEQKYAPVVKTAEELKAEREALTMIRRAEEFGKSTFADMQTWPGMDSKENRLAVADAIKAMGLQSDDPRDITLAANAAYRQVVLPKLATTERRAVLSELEHKAHATTVNPNAASTAAPKSYEDMTIAEALRHELAKAG